ncbi:hypothetical protein [Candidatus Nanohalobium constans]|uniref:Uncharacterized protein n=1 Tax=Candidatus Nanohalobium constans TaxID=2565781 RepID=A0A5Q0UGT9_9ARCH|nr:hypothetical protein [Candidatus Nanohalobium constans]QGA80420.1 hypothetical protein LC1Nh_0520 [Candidatus Nanohalobium constans]
MKTIALIAAVMVTVGLGAASGSESFFEDDFFDEGSGDSFFSEGSSIDISFDDDNFFSEDGDDSETPENGDDSDSESDVGVCVIGVDSPCNSDEYDGSEDSEDSETPEDGDESGESDEGDESDGSEDDGTVVEERTVTPAPEPSHVGEDYLSYPNPRDHYKHDQDIHREGSIKVCKILLNQNGEVITGETVDTTFSVETSIPYNDAETITFDTPINQVADLVGTSEELREGDGYLDAECAEFHDLRLNQTYSYSQETISGPDADKVETLGYIEKWENRNTPVSNVEDFNSSEDSDGTIRLEPGYNGRHAEVIIVNQITG